MTLIEFRALRGNGMAKQHWKKTATSKLLSKFKREYGMEDWRTLNSLLEMARQTSNFTLWYNTIDPFIKRISLEEELLKQIDLEKKKVKKEAARLFLEEQKKQDLEARRISSNIIRVNNLRSNVVVRRIHGA